MGKWAFVSFNLAALVVCWIFLREVSLATEEGGFSPGLCS